MKCFILCAIWLYVYAELGQHLCVCLCSLLALNAVASVLNDAYRKIIPHVICALDQAINTIYQRCECEYYTCCVQTCVRACVCVCSGHIVGCHCIDDMKFN